MKPPLPSTPFAVPPTTHPKPFAVPPAPHPKNTFGPGDTLPPSFFPHPLPPGQDIPDKLPAWAPGEKPMFSGQMVSWAGPYMMAGQVEPPNPSVKLPASGFTIPAQEVMQARCSSLFSIGDPRWDTCVDQPEEHFNPGSGAAYAKNVGHMPLIVGVTPDVAIRNWRTGWLMRGPVVVLREGTSQTVSFDPDYLYLVVDGTGKTTLDSGYWEGRGDVIRHGGLIQIVPPVGGFPHGSSPSLAKPFPVLPHGSSPGGLAKRFPDPRLN